MEMLEEFIRSLRIKHPTKGKISFELYDFQVELLKKFISKNHLVLLKSRQLGLTELTAAYALYIALTKPNSIIWYITDRSTHNTSFINRIYYSHSNIEDKQINIDRRTRYTLKFDNGSIIDASNGTDIVHRTNADLVIIDEAAWIKGLDDILASVIPCANNNKIIIQTTPSYYFSPFHKFWERITPIIGHRKIYERIQLPWTVHPERDSEWYHSVKRVMTPSKFAMEYECEFIKEGTV